MSCRIGFLASRRFASLAVLGVLSAPAGPGYRSASLTLIHVGAAGATPARFVSSQVLDTAAIFASARLDVDEANQAWVTGYRQRNAGMIAAAYADSGLFVALDGRVTRGRAAVARMYAARFVGLRPIQDGAVVRDGFAVLNAGCVYEWGHAWLEMAPATPGQPPVRSGGGYLTVWQLQTDRHWRIVRNLVL